MRMTPRLLAAATAATVLEQQLAGLRTLPDIVPLEAF